MEASARAELPASQPRVSLQEHHRKPLRSEPYRGATPRAASERRIERRDTMLANCPRRPHEPECREAPSSERFHGGSRASEEKGMSVACHLDFSRKSLPRKSRACRTEPRLLARAF